MENSELDIVADDGDLCLRLKNLMVLEPYNVETETFLLVLEIYDLLPWTVAWRDGEGDICRLYAVEDTEKLCPPFEIEFGELHLNMANGSRHFTRIPSDLQKDSGWKWLPGRSLRDMQPSFLPESTYKWLDVLALASEKSQAIPERGNLKKVADQL